MINTPMAELMRHTCANDLYEELYNIFMDYKDIIAIGWDTKGYSSKRSDGDYQFVIKKINRY